MVLTHAGFHVSICSENDIASIPQDPGIALAVMGHSMPAQQQRATAERVRLKWPEATILYLTAALDSPVLKISSSEYESGSGNPAYLIRACRHILDEAA